MNSELQPHASIQYYEYPTDDYSGFVEEYLDNETPTDKTRYDLLLNQVTGAGGTVLLTNFGSSDQYWSLDFRGMSHFEACSFLKRSIDPNAPVEEASAFTDEQAIDFLKDGIAADHPEGGDFRSMLDDSDVTDIDLLDQSNQTYQGERIRCFSFTVFRMTVGSALVFPDGRVLFSYDDEYWQYADWFDFDLPD